MNKCYEGKGAPKVQGENGPIIPTFRTAEEDHMFEARQRYIWEF